MLNLLDRVGPFLDQHGAVVYPLVAGVVLLAVSLTFVRKLTDAGHTPEQLWKLKQKILHLLEDEPQGLSCPGAAARLSVAPRHLKVVLEELIEDRFVIAEREPASGLGDQVIYKLKRFQGGTFN